MGKKMIKTKLYWRNNRWEAELAEETYQGVVLVFTAKLFVSPETLKQMEKNSRRFQINTMRTVWEDVPE